MKKIFIVSILLSMFTISCNKSGYVIKGHISDTTLFERSIFLSDAFSESSFDTTSIALDGSFKFEGDLGRNSEPILARISIEFSEIGTVLIVEPGTIDVGIDVLEDNSYIAFAKGTPLNDKLSKLDLDARVLRDTLSTRLVELEQVALPEDELTLKRNEYISDYINNFGNVCNKTFTRNNNNLVGLFALLQWSDIDPTINMDSLLDCSGDVIKENPLIQSQIEYVNKIAATQVGKTYTDLTGINQQGNTVSLSEYVGKGKLVVLDFWASWCEPCMSEIPNLANIAKKYSDQVTVVGINVWDQLDEFRRVYSEQKIFWPQIIDVDKQKFTEIYSVIGIPHIMLIDKNGVIVARGLRGNEILLAIEEELLK